MRETGRPSVDTRLKEAARVSLGVPVTFVAEPKPSRTATHISRASFSAPCKVALKGGGRAVAAGAAGSRHGNDSQNYSMEPKKEVGEREWGGDGE